MLWLKGDDEDGLEAEEESSSVHLTSCLGSLPVRGEEVLIFFCAVREGAVEVALFAEEEEIPVSVANALEAMALKEADAAGTAVLDGDEALIVAAVIGAE